MASAPVTIEQGAPPSLVVVSNRLPFEVQRTDSGPVFSRAPGGLVTALEASLRERGGVWIGWPGVEHSPDGPPWTLPDADPIVYLPVELSAREIAQYYGNFANRTLWPLLHSFISRTRMDPQAWGVYERVNARFAEVAAQASEPDGLVWVHDYQLMRVPLLLRRLVPQRRVAYFHHVPFPAADVVRVLPWARSIIAGLLGADLIGFHIREYAEHFLESAHRLLGCEIDRSLGRVQFEGRTISVEAHPISIDSALQERMARRSLGMFSRPRQILGVDRLDYTKGITERLHAVEQLFERYPGYRGAVVFTQVMVPSRERVDEYQMLKRQIDEIVGRINGRFSDTRWSPIRYLVRSIPPDELAGLYRSAQVALVTPLRDGMNLVAKEYVASQVDDDGVLVLSELAGAAAELPEALVVNPYDIDAVTEALHRALEMPPDERHTRMAALRHRVRSNDVSAWSSRFLESALAAGCRRAAAPSAVLTAQRRLSDWIASRPALALFIDYDGTLTPIVARPDLAVLGDEAHRVLEQAVRAPDLDTVIVSGRTVEDVRRMVGIEGLTYVGDHGYQIEGPGLSYWHKAADRFQRALDGAARDFETILVPGAWVERKRATVALHVRAVADALVGRVTRDAEAICRRWHLAVMIGKAVIEGRPPVAWDKGQAVLHILRARQGPDWPSRVRALYIGDDATDEFAFRSLRGIGRSILVAPPGAVASSAADLSLPGPDDVLQFVRWLASGAVRAAGA